jgi:hypothetical protein
MELGDLLKGIVTIAGCIGVGAVGAEVRAWFKARHDGRKEDRGDALGEWAKIHDRDEARYDKLMQKVDVLEQRADDSEQREQMLMLKIERQNGQIEYLRRVVRENKIVIDDWNPEDSAMHRPLPAKKEA